MMTRADFENEGLYQGGVSPDDVIVIYIDGVEKYRGIPAVFDDGVTVENVTVENRASLVNWYRFDVIGDYEEILITTGDEVDLGPVMTRAEFEDEGLYQGGVSPNDVIVIYIDGEEKYRDIPEIYTNVDV